MSKLQSHRRTHDDRRIYQCKHCRLKFLSLRHRCLHKCGRANAQAYRCHLCSAKFGHILSLSGHLQKYHFTYKKKRSDKYRTKVLSTGSAWKKNKDEDDKKVLLKITLGRSMTIISPTKKPSKDSRRKSGKKKSKKRRRKEGIILSIKNGAVKRPEKRTRDKSKMDKIVNDLPNGLLKASALADGLKLRIKAFPDVSASPKRDFTSAMSSVDSLGKGMRNLVQSVEPEIRVVEPPKAVNGIVIMKDKTGKFSAGQLKKKKNKKRENMFDCLKETGVWKVMPSPRPDRGGPDVLKLKLSPHKPVKFESVEECNSARYLDIPVKPRGDLSSEESDVLELPSYDKESSAVNDSGIEVSSSSSCNNGNSVHSVVLDENSPSYFNTEDSLLSFDSPHDESGNKSEHSICHRCGGIILETNTISSRSPGKCRCSLSNPNSPFQTPISPVKLSDIQKSQDVTNLPLSVSPCVDLEKTDSTNTSKCDELIESINNTIPFSNYESGDKAQISDSDSDIVLLTDIGSKKMTSPEKEFKGKLKLKLRTKDQSKSSVKKEWEATTSSPNEEKADNIYAFEDEKALYEKPRKKLFAGSEKQHNDKLSSILKSPKKSGVTENVNLTIGTPNKSSVPLDTLMKAKSGSIKTPLVIDEVKEKEKLESSDSKVSADQNKLSRKKPLFKSKGKLIRSESMCNEPNVETIMKESLTENKHSVENESEKVVKSTKRPLFKKAVSVDESSEPAKKRPLFKKNTVSPVTSKLESNSKSEQKESENDILRTQKDHLPVDKQSVKDKTSEHENKVSEKSKVNESVKKNTKKPKAIESQNKNNKTTKALEKDNKAIKQSKAIEKKNKNIKTPKASQKPSNNESITNSKSNENLSKIIEKSEASENENKNTEQLGGTEAEENEKPKTKRSLSNPLDLFQQQFLSFLSTNKTAGSEAKSEPMDVDDNSKRSIAGNVEESLSENTEPFKVMENSALDKSGSSTVSWLGMGVNKGSESLSNSDSFSWLRIFNDNSNTEGDSKTPQKEVQGAADLGVDLASLNKKMDESDDDAHSLDMDFNTENLSALKPKPSVEKAKVRRLISSDNESKNKPIRRRQKAKRTGPKHRPIKKAVDLDFVYSEDSAGEFDNSHMDSDPDFNPTDSDDDFVKRKPAVIKRRVSRNCSQSRKISVLSNEHSDSGSESNNGLNVSDVESTGLRQRRRSKESNKSHCPCCLGGQNGQNGEAYKLPKRHKQFIRSTLRLLDLQRKLRVLFLTLFPDCVEIIDSCKAGTNEFVELIDDILSGMGEPDHHLMTLYPDLSVNTKPAMLKTDFNECQVNNIGMSFTSPDSASRPSEIDFASNEEKVTERSVFDALDSVNDRSCLHSQTSTGFSASKSSLKVENKTLVDDLASEGNTSPAKQLLSTQDTVKTTSPSYSQSLLAIAASASGSVTVTDSGISHTSATTPSSGSDRTSISASPSTSCTHIDSCRGNTTCHGSLGDATCPAIQASDCNSLPFDSTDFFQATEQAVPMVNITIDLNAAKVALCNNPKSCLDKLHSQVIRLTHHMLPEVEFKNYFFRNLDNLEFLVDLLIDANAGREIVVDEEPAEVESEYKPLWPDSMNSALIVPENEALTYGFLVAQSSTVYAEPEDTFLSDDLPGNDSFKEKIKLQRESLKKDLFVIEEDKPVYSEDVSEKVLDSIETYHKIAQQRQQSPRKRSRDSRLRKRTADEKRTLFVQEKIQNTHNSTFVCVSKSKVSEGPSKKAGKQKHAQNSKEHFLSQLNVGDKVEKLVNGSMNKIEHNISAVDSDQVSNVGYKTNEEPTSLQGLERRKSGFGEEGKNIFELISNA